MTTETLGLLLKNYPRKQEKLFGYQIFLTTLWQNVSWSMQDAASTYTIMDVKYNMKAKLYIVDGGINHLDCGEWGLILRVKTELRHTQHWKNMTHQV